MVTGVHVAQPPRRGIENADEQRRVHRSRRVRFDVAIDLVGEIADRSWPSARRVRSDAWMFAMSSAAPTPLPDTSPTSSATWPLGDLEVVEEVAADFARRHRHALDLRQSETERRVRQHLVLNLASELELALDALLLDGGALMPLDVLRHLIECHRELADLVARP